MLFYILLAFKNKSLYVFQNWGLNFMVSFEI